jgi:hypothetical protein
MKNSLNLLKILKKNTQSGYTLIELIIASVLTVLVVSAAGMGVVLMTQKNMIASADGDIKYNLGRAVDFMSEEVKTASLIRDDVSSSALTTNAVNFTQSGKTVVLAIKVPGVSQDIIYYTQAPGSPWLGNLGIHRWGPTLDSSGAYTDATNPSAWTGQLLVDLIADTPLTTGCASGGTINNTAGATTGWTQIPNSSQKGFYVCIDNTNQISGNGKSVEIHATASDQNNTISNPLGWGSGSGGGYAATGKPNYEVITQAYARTN